MPSYLISGAINQNASTVGANALNDTDTTSVLISSGLDPQANNIGCPTVSAPNFVSISFIIINPATGTITDREDCFITSFVSGTGQSAGATIARAKNGTTQLAWPEGSLWIATPGTTRTVQVTAPGPTPSINLDTTDVMQLFGLSEDITNMSTNLSGNAIDNQPLVIEFKDTGSPINITWGDKFQSTPGTTLPSSTPGGGTRYRTGFFFDSTTGKLACVAVS